jgi:mRNA interferase RelE/StbE
MKILLTNSFKRASKKLHRNQITFLEEAIKTIQIQPLAGELKIGDLAGVRVYKFRIFHQLILLAYTYDEKSDTLNLLSFASHENFYDDLKKQINH